MAFKYRCLGSVTLLLALIGAIPGTSTPSVSAAGSNKLAGTWLMNITATNCQTGLALGTFSSLYSFADGGTLTNVTNGASPAVRSPGLGSWKPTGDHTFKSVSMALMFSAAGVWAGTQKIANTFEILDDRDALTGSVSVEIYNTSGGLTSTMCATLVGQRMEP